MADWTEFQAIEGAKPYYKKLYETVQEAYSKETCYPPMDKIMNAFSLTPFDKVKCVIIGQDPYHGPNQAMGLSFSVPKGVTIPPSLKNIYKEIQTEYGYPIPSHGDLTGWAEQGVLLLNAVLTVCAHQPAAHKNIGWEEYTSAAVSYLNQKETPVVFMLWGRFAKDRKPFITNPKHLVLEATHPSPYSADGFFGCDHFRKCNEFLEKNGIEPINWQIT